jgi:hypothetical protein
MTAFLYGHDSLANGVYLIWLLFCSSNLIFEALRSAWRDEYSGNYHELLFNNINRIPRTEMPYSNQISIVQSSGTGKSRMVHEQANLVFTIPFNLRERDDDKGPYFIFRTQALLTYRPRSGLPHP